MPNNLAIHNPSPRFPRATDGGYRVGRRCQIAEAGDDGLDLRVGEFTSGFSVQRETATSRNRRSPRPRSADVNQVTAVSSTSISVRAFPMLLPRHDRPMHNRAGVVRAGKGVPYPCVEEPMSEGSGVKTIGQDAWCARHRR